MKIKLQFCEGGFMSSDNLIEEGSELHLDFSKISSINNDVIPCAVQDIDSGEVILVAYVNDEALKLALKSRAAVFWSTSRNEIWEKGKTSGETFALLEVLVNCEQNSLVYKVRPNAGGICHTKNQNGDPRNCYYRSIDFSSTSLKSMDL